MPLKYFHKNDFGETFRQDFCKKCRENFRDFPCFASNFFENKKTKVLVSTLARHDCQLSPTLIALRVANCWLCMKVKQDIYEGC
jgi:hypothetical protein